MEGKNTNMLIGITGQKRRGKDTIANYLVENHKFNRHGFADKVKSYAYAQNPIIVSSLAGETLRLQEIVDETGWERAKEIPEVRGLLQRTGTEAGRSIFWKNFWVDVLFRELEEKYLTYETGYPLHKELQSRVVISDVRFDNEAERIKEYGGHIIHVTSSRDGLPQPDNHASEQPINPKYVDKFIDNSSTIEDLFPLIESALEEFSNHN